MDSTDTQVIQYLLNGKYLLALGVVIVAIAQALKLGLGTVIPWFKTSKLGGYLVGFGTSALIYFGTALQQSVAITWQLVSMCLVMAFAASGKYETIGDIAGSIKSGMAKRRILRDLARSARSAGGSLRVLVVASAIAGVSILPLAILPSSGCTPAQRTAAGSAAESTAIACATQDYQGLIGPVTTALESGGSLAALESAGLSDAIACAVRVALNVFTAAHAVTACPGASTPAQAPTPPVQSHAITVPPFRARAELYLSTKHFKD